MVRTVLGGIVAGVILFFIGFVFWGTPLREIPFAKVDETRNAAVQTALAQNLTEGGTGTYIIPWPDTAEGTILYGRGPIATVHFNTGGFPAMDSKMLIVGFVFALVTGMAIAFALAAVSAGRSFASMARLVILFSVALTFWLILGQPVFNHYGWGYWIYAFIAETTALIAAGLVIARWFLPRDAAEARAAPVEATEAGSGI